MEDHGHLTMFEDQGDTITSDFNVAELRQRSVVSSTRRLLSNLTVLNEDILFFRHGKIQRKEGRGYDNGSCFDVLVLQSHL
ncbi:hypothetical protein RvY_05013 [Ramazzottius varieornatus]|uniref:Uncharacterized protein n=1 Tax=Ramazzottius varieornatus TaxID=947166 RepID=A0A1D1V2N9_RAMVA|nr:hypothetical protein RvY_05013 [Ramazzottius varieornatus]